MKASETRVRQLIVRLWNYADQQELEGRYLKKELEELRKELKLEGFIKTK